MLNDQFRRLIARAEDLGLEELDHLTREELEPAIVATRSSGRAPDILELRDEFSARVGYLRDYLASRLARRWNDEAPDVPIEREPLARDMRQFYLEELDEFEKEVNALSLNKLFTPAWLAGVRADIDSWMGDDSFGSPSHAPFVAFFQDRVDGRAWAPYSNSTRYPRSSRRQTSSSRSSLCFLTGSNARKLASECTDTRS
jgi:hypothetical protein